MHYLQHLHAARLHGRMLLDADKGGGGGAGVLEPAQFQKKVLDGVEAMQGKIGSIEKRISESASAEELKKLQDDFDKLVAECRDIKKVSLSLAHRSLRPARPGQVSEECARHLGAIFLLAAVRQEKVEGGKRDLAYGMIKDILGIEAKAALTTSDIPLPTEWSGEIVEMVSQFGAARRYGTVFPLGAGQVKLPRLGTDPQFTLIAMSAAVGEKSPTVVFVTFNAEKFGGIIRLPTEIDEDSIVAMGQFLARYSARQTAFIEDYNFFASTGAGSGANGTVAGLQFSTITNAKVVQMIATKTHYSDATLANFRAIRAVVDAPVIGMSAYYMHPTFEQHLSGLNTAGDKPYQANGLNGATLDGFPIRWVDVMPAFSTAVNVSKVFALFGDPSYQYLGVRGGFRFDTSREAGFTTDEILVRALERFTIGLMAVGSVSGLETAAS